MTRCDYKTLIPDRCTPYYLGKGIADHKAGGRIWETAGPSARTDLGELSMQHQVCRDHRPRDKQLSLSLAMAPGPKRLGHPGAGGLSGQPAQKLTQGALQGSSPDGPFRPLPSDPVLNRMQHSLLDSNPLSPSHALVNFRTPRPSNSNTHVASNLIPIPTSPTCSMMIHAPT